MMLAKGIADWTSTLPSRLISSDSALAIGTSIGSSRSLGRAVWNLDDFPVSPRDPFAAFEHYIARAIVENRLRENTPTAL